MTRLDGRLYDYGCNVWTVGHRSCASGSGFGHGVRKLWIPGRMDSSGRHRNRKTSILVSFPAHPACPHVWSFYISKSQPYAQRREFMILCKVLLQPPLFRSIRSRQRDGLVQKDERGVRLATARKGLDLVPSDLSDLLVVEPPPVAIFL